MKDKNRGEVDISKANGKAASNKAIADLALEHLNNISFGKSYEHLEGRIFKNAQEISDDKNFKEAVKNLAKLYKAGYPIYDDEKLKVALINALIKQNEYTAPRVNQLHESGITIEELLKNDTIYSEVSKKLTSGTLYNAWYDASGIKGLKVLIKAGTEITSENIQGVRSINLSTLKLAISKNVSKNELELLVSKMLSADLKDALSWAFSNEGTVDLQILLIDMCAKENIKSLDSDKTLLITAIRNRSIEVVQKLLVSGVNIHLEEKALQEALANSPEEIKDLVATYNSMERYFQKEVLPGIKSMAKKLDPKANITNEYVIAEVNEILKNVYKDDSALPEYMKYFTRLYFMELAMIDIASSFKSILSDKTYREIKFEKMAEAIYEKIKTTPEFKKLATPIAGKNLVEFQRNVVDFQNTEIAEKLATEFGKELLNSRIRNDGDAVSAASQLTLMVLGQLDKDLGTPLDKESKEKIQKAIADSADEIIKEGSTALNVSAKTLDRLGDRSFKEVCDKADFSKMRDLIKAVMENARAIANNTEKEQNGPKTEGRFTDHIREERSQSSARKL